MPHRRLEYPALKVHQWLPQWEEVRFDEHQHRARPAPHFFIFSLPAFELRLLSGIHRRSTAAGTPRAEDLGIQRRHDPERSKEIREYVLHGYPWSDLTQAQRKQGQYSDLKKPGWLPTAVVVNILRPTDRRAGKKVEKGDVIEIDEKPDGGAIVKLPGNDRWKPSGIPPIEVIDGQHRLWAFEAGQDIKFDLPVVAFHGLDVSWQAYLFWSINIKPKRINPSLAFDLYPLLRTEDWLERLEGPSVYRATRAQELTEALWAHPTSPWHQRINMLGESGRSGVTQAAWIRSLMATFIRSWEGTRIRIGGLFGAPVGDDEQVLPWTRAQQAAFLIGGWRAFLSAVSDSSLPWARELRKAGLVDTPNFDAAFYGKHTLIESDQGVRGFLHILNDITYLQADSLELREWRASDDAAAVDNAAVSQQLETLSDLPVGRAQEVLGKELAKFDWRAASAPNLDESERTKKLTYKGGGGYKELRLDLLEHIRKVGSTHAPIARDALAKLR